MWVSVCVRVYAALANDFATLPQFLARAVAAATPATAADSSRLLPQQQPWLAAATTFGQATASRQPAAVSRRNL